MSGKYEDIIHLPHHVSSKRPPMPMADRAAQFSPFAALTGYDDAIRETGRLTEQKIQLDEEALATLDEKFHALQEHLDESPEIQFAYFQPDERKAGGTYITVSGIVKKIQEYERQLILPASQTGYPDGDHVSHGAEGTAWGLHSVLCYGTQTQ